MWSPKFSGDDRTRTGNPLRARQNHRFSFTCANDEEIGWRHYEGLCFHNLRHTTVALAIPEGAHPKATQERPVHSSITLTLVFNLRGPRTWSVSP